MGREATEAQLGWAKVLKTSVLELHSLVERPEVSPKHIRDAIDDIVISLQNLRRTV